MARISTIQTVSVINQPVDANERLTLIEKLEREYKKWCDCEDNSVFGGVEQLDARGRTRGLKDAIDIVKQHSEWVRVDEQKPQDDISYLVLCDDGSVWMGHYNLLIKPNDWYLHGWSTHEGWHPFVITHFMLPPKPPSEVQE